MLRLLVAGPRPVRRRFPFCDESICSWVRFRGAFFVGGNWGELGELVGVGNYWKEVDPETALCRLGKVTTCQGRPPLLVNAETAVTNRRFLLMPGLVDARWEKMRLACASL